MFTFTLDGDQSGRGLSTKGRGANNGKPTSESEAASWVPGQRPSQNRIWCVFSVTEHSSMVEGKSNIFTDQYSVASECDSVNWISLKSSKPSSRTFNGNWLKMNVCEGRKNLIRKSHLLISPDMQQNGIDLIGNNMGSDSSTGWKPKRGSAAGPLTLTTNSSPVVVMAKVALQRTYRCWLMTDIKVIYSSRHSFSFCMSWAHINPSQAECGPRARHCASPV